MLSSFFFFFFFNDTATTEIYTLSLHDALPICRSPRSRRLLGARRPPARASRDIPCRLHHRAWDGGGAAAGPRGGSARLPAPADQPAGRARKDSPLGGEVTSPQFLVIVSAVQGAPPAALV